MKNALVALVLFLGVGSTAFGAVFVVPDDAELVHKSNAIVTGRVSAASARRTADGTIETVYRVHVDRRLKGLADSSIDIVSPGGEVGGKFLAVPGAAHFNEGDQVLLFLTLHKGQWTPTDMTVGKFRFVTSTGGQSLLVRDEEDIVGFDRDMRPHVEKVRRQDEFLRFITEVVRGRNTAAQTYFVDPQETLALEQETEPKGFDVEATADYAASSYAIRFNSGGIYYPGRWPSSRMTASLARQFFKNSANNASGLGDGGVSQITSMLAAWTNDCPSAVNVTYGGTSANLKNPDDNVNLVVYNDPGNHIAPDTWTGSGVIATAYMSGDAFHTYDGASWVSLSDSDIVVQKGLTGTESFMPTAMTHETGHAIGLRHSNTHFDGSACQASDECTSSAVMNSSVSTLYGYVPQPWDLTAIRAIYPNSCAPTNPTRYDHNGDGKADIYWRNSSNGQNWIYLMNGNVVQTNTSTRNEPNLAWKVAGIADFDGDGKSDILWRNDATGVNYLYKMDGATATPLFITQEPNRSWKIAGVGDFNGDGKADIYWRNSSNGQNWIYLMNGNVIQSSLATRNEANQDWQIAAIGDFNGDGKDDLYWRNSATGGNYIYQMDGASATALPTRNEVNLSWEVVGVGDFNEDGKDDIYWRNNVSGWNYIYQMNGATATPLGTRNETNLAWKVANIADYNGDGMADVLWRNDSTGQNYMYQMNANTVTANLPVQNEPNLSWVIQN
jgi:hypothetical protein